MKKILVVLLIIILSLSIVVAFVACNSNSECDCGTIPTVCDCRTIPAACSCSYGNVGCDCELNLITSCDCTPSQFNIYGIGDTFTYVTHTGIPLISIYMTRYSSTQVRFVVHNYNIPSFATNFLRMNRHDSAGANLGTNQFWDTTVPIGSSSVQYATAGNGNILRFGWSTNITWFSMIPFVVFHV